MMKVFRRLNRAFTRHLAIRALVATLGLLSAYSASSINLPENFIIETYVSGIDRPIEMSWTTDGRLFVAQKSGKVWVVENDALLPTPFIDIQGEVNAFADRGLLGMTVHPNFPTTPYVYLAFTYDPPETAGQGGLAAPNEAGVRVARVIRVTADPNTGFNTAIPGSEFILMGTNSTWANVGDPAAEQDDLTAAWACGNEGEYVRDCIPADGISHSIGTLAFGNDGSLYFSTGDAGTWTTVDLRTTRALDPDSMAGKVFRINPETGEGYETNPFAEPDDLGSNRSKVWQMGFRNPYRFTIDPLTDELWIGDVGWNRWEELNHSATPGANFGWPCYEGASGAVLEQGGYSVLGVCQDLYAENNTVPANYAYYHDPEIGGAIISGDFYDRIDWPAEYQGALFFGDFAFQEINYAHIAGEEVDIHTFATDVLMVDISVGPDGNLYIAKIADDSIDRIVYGEPTNLPITSFGSGFSADAPAPGWAYLWNKNAALGNSAGYVPLLWDGVGLYDSDGVAGLPDPAGLGDGHIGQGVMHSGYGQADGAPWDYYGIAEYTTGEGGYYSITNSSVSNIGCAFSDGIEVVTLVDDAALPGPLSGLVVAGNLDRNLGYLVAGTRIAIALGPNGTADCDSTNIDWDITFVAGDPPPGSPPVARIITPLSTDLWIVGDEVHFSGSATDPDDGVLTGDALTWQVTLHHNTHEHFDAGSATGAEGSFEFPDHGANTYAELCLTATDSDGRSGTDCIDVRPQTVTYNFNSVPSGLEVTFNSETYTTPFTIAELAVNGERLISAAPLQGQYQFTDWSIGGDATQQIIIGDVDLSITANYNDLGSVPLSFDAIVSAGSDDAEERATGQVSLTSTDLELVRGETDGLSQIVGLRFSGITIPKGAQIVDAYVQFTVDETSTEATSLLIEGQAAGNAATFTSAGQNVSGRARTDASVAWEPGPWASIGERGYLQRTPNIAPVIGEIVSGADWASGNALALIVTGTGLRTAISFERFNEKAPHLYISYIVPAVPLSVVIDAVHKDPTNMVYPNQTGEIPVAVFSSSEFDASQINPATLKYGIGEASPVTNAKYFDLDSQYGNDLTIRFEVADSGIVCNDTEVTLSGETYTGDHFVGTDFIDASNCDDGCHNYP